MSIKEEKIQLTHPNGKKLPRIDKHKYDIMKKAILSSLKKGPSTHNEMYQNILRDFQINKTKFEGAVEWYMEGVKLDLEATGQIARLNDQAPHQWKLMKS